MKFTPRKKGLSTPGRYALVFAALMAAFFLLLYLAGLVPQRLVFENVKASAAQFHEESRQPSAYGCYPQLLYHGEGSYQLDNGSELRILHQSLYLDTRADPASVLENPYWAAEESDGPLEDLRQLSRMEEPPAPNNRYSRYLMGFRAVVRPLLALFPYPEIRRIVMWTVLLLFALVTAGFAKRMGLRMALLFAGCFLTANPVMIVSSLQFSCCFVLAFAAMAAVLFLRTSQECVPLLLFITGALTQYFDFYTTPVLTLVLPAGTALLLLQQEGRLQRPKQALIFLGRCLLAWAAAYVGSWLCKLALTELCTDEPAWRTAMASFAGRLGLSGTGEYDASFYSPLRALRLCAANLLSPGSAVLFLGIAALLLWRFLRAGDKRALLAAAPGYLALALVPVIWIMVAAQPSIIHEYFQYRTLTGTVFAACCMAALPRPDGGNREPSAIQ